MEREEIYRITNSGKVIPVGELVRCKDCKYCREAHYEEDGEPPIIKLKCENKYGLCRYQAEPYGFCSNGERKDGGK